MAKILSIPFIFIYFCLELALLSVIAFDKITAGPDLDPPSQHYQIPQIEKSKTDPDSVFSVHRVRILSPPYLCEVTKTCRFKKKIDDPREWNLIKICVGDFF